MTNDNLEDKIKNNFLQTSRILSELAETEAAKIIMAGKMIAETFKNGGKILACGNGGSAADAQHFAAEFIARNDPQHPSMPAISLAADPSVVTALANDYGFESIFAGQIEGLGKAGDVLVAISTSGKSANVLAAIKTAKAKGLKVIALVGDYVDESIKKCDLHFSVPLNDTPRIQEVHAVILHSIWECVDKFQK